MPDPSTRLAELSGRLAEVRERIAGAARRSGRQPSDVTLVVVTKTWPLADVGALFDLGVRDFGESRHPEAQHKAAGLGAAEARWHFIGQLQSNKAVPVAAYADVVHSVDSVRLAHRLNAGAHRADRIVDALVQVSLDEPTEHAGRGGVAVADVAAVAAAIDTAGALRLRGVLGIAPPGGDPAAAYSRLATTRDALCIAYPEATWLSAGMSGDFEAAIECGATHVRVGSAILGRRPPLR